MAYIVHLSETDRAYLDQLPLSDQAKRKVQDFIAYAIAGMDDAFRNDPNNRHERGGPYFVRELILLDDEGDGRFHKVWFVVRDAGASAGVLEIVYVEHHKGAKWTKH